MKKYKLKLKVTSELNIIIKTDDNIEQYIKNMCLYHIDDFSQCEPYDFEVIDYEEL